MEEAFLNIIDDHQNIIHKVCRLYRDSRKELLAMIKIQNHPKLNRIRIRLIIEVKMLVAFLAAYNDIIVVHNLI